MPLPRLIDNQKVNLSETLKEIAPQHKNLSIATGYWDLPGTLEIIHQIKDYKSIRLLIGQEPLSSRRQKQFHLDMNNPENLFPDDDIKYDLENSSTNDELHSLRETAKILTNLIKEGKLEVKIFRIPRLHAKAYIFGNLKDDIESVGIVGSSNFTKAGLTSNTELNSLEDDYRIVSFQPTTNLHENGHISWFNDLWDNPSAIKWDGEFMKIIQNSPVGDLTYGAYDVYIKTLMEVYPDELIPPKELGEETSDILYEFQNRNAGILINKLEKKGLAILSDSVGLGKTITAGAVIKHYLDKADGKANIQVIAPAALKQQWIDDLSSILNVEAREGAFDIVSLQDSNAIREIIEYYNKEWRKAKNIDLIVIDEAHNLRSKSGTRHDVILELLQQHPDSHILLLTATPINNSLMDIANQIQLASKGRRVSVNVPYIRPGGKDIEMLDFFEALKRIQSLIRKAERNGDDIDILLETVKPTIHEGLRHYLVRSTRQGIEAEGGIVDKTGKTKPFPKSCVESINYRYKEDITFFVSNTLENHVIDCFEGIDPRKLNLLNMSEFTQQSSHPLDFLSEIIFSDADPYNIFALDKDKNANMDKLYLDNNVESLVLNILQSIYILGFTPYRPDVYNHKYYGKTVDEIRALSNVPISLGIQRTVHNILHVTWLKRMESSAAALMYSLKNYLNRIELFEKYLNLGYIVNLVDASLLESDYNDGADIDKAFDDYEKYFKEKEELIDSGKDPNELRKYGIEKKKADPKVFNIKQMKQDLARDRKIIELLEIILLEVTKPKYDTKMQSLYEHMIKLLSMKKYGEKILVFSFFADTINYLKDNLGELFKDSEIDFNNTSEFISGQSGNFENIVRRFSPKSKKYKLKSDETKIDFLFSTDVLSEGQNLQDAGILINYDLHWNPVRMIQRNGRINRLGSDFSDVMISNMKPTDELEMYLKLVNRLENKIKTIKNTIGLDQGVLDSTDVNPIEFIEKYYTEGILPEEDDDFLAHTDEHIIELRKFLGKQRNNLEEIQRIKDISKGKWNYLPKHITHNDSVLSLINTYGTTSDTNKEISDLFFVDVSKKNDEYIATFIDYSKALNLIRTSSSDNEKRVDTIHYDRLKVISRATAEARRQASNPDSQYKITPQYERAILIISGYFDKRVDFRGIIERGVVTTVLQRELETVLRKVNNESKKKGSVYSSTIAAFEKVFKQIQTNVSEEKIIDKAEGVLFYAG